MAIQALMTCRALCAYLGLSLQWREPFLTQILSELVTGPLRNFAKVGIDPQEKPPAKRHKTRCIVINGRLESNSCKIAAVAAERWHQNTGSRHSQSLWIGGELARVGIVSTDEIISYTVSATADYASLPILRWWRLMFRQR